MADTLEEILIDNVPRKMGRTLPTAEHLLMRGGMQSFTDYLHSINKDLLSVDQWQEVDNAVIFDQSFVNDQLRFGACVGASAAQAFIKQRVLRGQPKVDLSWAYLYDQINNGRDNGAVITDAMGVLLTTGCPLFADYQPVPQFNKNNQPASRLRFKLDRALTLSSWQEICTAIQMGFIVQYPVMVGNNYGNFDGDGCCGFTRGPGNHSVHADGLIKLPRGEWVLAHSGTWGPTWGPWRNGRAYHTQRMVEGCAMADDAYCHIDAIEDDQDQDQPPEVAA